MDARIRLEPTAALVVDLGMKLFAADALTRRYVDRLDLSSTAEMVEEYKKAGIYELACESMCNRKFTIRHALFNALDEREAPAQVLVLAAGKSPLALEACIHKPARVGRVFEVDISPFAEKVALYEELAPKEAKRITFIEHDIASDSLPTALAAQGYDAAARTVIVLEGITHYLPPAVCREVIARFASQKHQNALVFEYGMPFDVMSDAIRPHALVAYGAIEKRYHPQGMTKYVPSWFKSLFKQLGGRLAHIYHMDEMERLRTGSNRFFPYPNSGWVEVAEARL